MSPNALPRMWNRVARWFSDNASHATVRFIPDVDAEPVQPYAGYLRLWVSEGFLAKQTSWGTDRFPVVHGGASLTFLGAQPATFTTVARAPAVWSAPGVQWDFSITPLLPFNGGTVEIEAALYVARVGEPLHVALDVLSGVASLLGPPLSVAATIADKISDGVDTVVAADGNRPALAVHTAMVSPGGSGPVLRPGHLVVLHAPEAELHGTPTVEDGLLHLRDGAQRTRPTGVDYLVVRVECRSERDDWRFPDLDALIREAGEALLRGHDDTYRDLRTDAVSRAWNNPDLTAVDRRRVALLVAEELDELGKLGIVPGPERALHELAGDRLVHPADPQLDTLTLSNLIGAG